MKRLALLGVLVPAVLLAKSDQPGAALVAADEAFAKMARNQGEWTAFRSFAGPRSEMFAPRRVLVSEFGKGLPDPKVATRWRPEQAWISCDATVGVTFGRWSLPGSKMHGWYETVWAKMRDGSYKMLLRHAWDVPRQLLAKPGRKGARGACTGKPGLPIVAPDVGTDFKFGASYDQTLIWSSAVSAQSEVRIVVSLWDGTRHVPVLVDPAPNPPLTLR